MSASVALMLASCAESNEGAPSVVVDAGSDAAAEADADAAEPDAAVVAADPSPPLQECNAATPCPLAVPAPISSARNLVALSGSGRNDVWAVGSSSTVLHFDGTEWAAPTSWVGAAAGQNTLRGIWLARSDDVWFLEGTEIVHCSGWRGASATQFERLNAVLTNAADLAGAPGGAAWNVSRGENGGANVLFHWSPWAGASTAAIDNPIVNYGAERLLALSVPDANTLWGAGEGGRIFRVWRPLPEGGAEPPPESQWQTEEWNSHTTTALSDVSARDGEVWAVGARGLVRRLGMDKDGFPRFLPIDTGSTSDLRAVHVFSANDVWIVGDRATILHFDGTSWRRVPTPFEGAAERPALHAVWGADPDDVWFVGQGITLRLQRSDSKP